MPPLHHPQPQLSGTPPGDPSPVVDAAHRPNTVPEVVVLQLHADDPIKDVGTARQLARALMMAADDFDQVDLSLEPSCSARPVIVLGWPADCMSSTLNEKDPAGENTGRVLLCAVLGQCAASP